MKKISLIKSILIAIIFISCNNIYSQQYDLVFSAAQNLAVISGTINYSGGTIPPNSATVELYQKLNITEFNRVDTIPLTGMVFQFDSVNAGEYFVHVRIDDNSFDPYVLSTYYDSVATWKKADTLIVNCDSTYDININIYEITPPAGIPTGSITGYIYYTDAGFKSSLEAGNPVTGGEIYIELEPDDEPIANTETDTAGFYSFTGLPEGNTYSLNVDIPGLPMISTYTITVGGGDTTFTSLNFYVDTSATNGNISIDTITKIPLYINPVFSISIYPNPAQNNMNLVYELKKSGRINIELLDNIGRNTVLLINSEQQQGTYNYNLNATKNNFKKGIWFLKFTVDKTVYLKKIIIE